MPWHRRLRSLAIALAVICAWSPVAGQETDREADLERIRDEIATLRSRLNQLRQQASDLRGELKHTELAVELQEKRHQEARKAREVAEDSLLELQAEIDALTLALQQLRVRLRDRLVHLYRLGRQGYLRLFLSIHSAQDLLPGIRQLRYLAKRDGGLLESYLDTQARLGFKREELRERADTVQRWLQAEAVRLDQLELLRNKQIDKIVDVGQALAVELID